MPDITSRVTETLADSGDEQQEDSDIGHFTNKAERKREKRGWTHRHCAFKAAQFGQPCFL